MSGSKRTIIGVVIIVSVALLGGGYALGNGRVFNKPDTPITNTSKTIPSQTPKTIAKTTTANTYPPSSTIQGAVDNYLAAKGVTTGTNTITNLQTVGAAARGKLENGDSGGVFYAHQSDNMWTVVFAGQTTIPQSVVTQYGMPAEWAGQTNWQ